MKTMILQLLYKTNFEFCGLLMYLSPVSSSQFLANYNVQISSDTLRGAPSFKLLFFTKCDLILKMVAH